MSGRFQMTFGNSYNQQLLQNIIIANYQSTGQMNNISLTNGRLNAPMIDRVYKARAGCSACGKKAM